MKKIQNNYPINNFLINNFKKKAIRFHMPGHNGGKGFKRTFKRHILEWDITEIKGADNLHNPTGIIEKSLQKISEKEKCLQSFFLVNGSSSGIQTIIKYITIKGGELLVSRDCHKSVINSTILFDCDVSFAFNDYDDINNVSLPISLGNIKEVVEKNSNIKFVLITSPNYYGLTADIKGIGEYLHKKNIMLIVDQAHGSHFIQSDLLPNSALLNGADIVIESVHKTLPTLNPGALLHINNSLIDIKILKEIINSLLTTSPSYIVMASIEQSILMYMQKEYKRLFKYISNFKKDIKFNVLENDDFSRIVINVKNSLLSGYEIKDLLSKKNIEIEMADLYNIILITNPYNKKSDFKKLSKILNKLEYYKHNYEKQKVFPKATRAIKMADAYKMDTKSIELDRANGCVCGTMVVPYPPGIPLLYLGEIIDNNSITYIKEILNKNGEIIGINNNIIKIIEE